MPAMKRKATEEEKRRGRRFGGNPPEPPTGGVREQDQINLTDEDSRIMKVAAGGFEQCYNAQAAVATGSLLVVATAVTQAANDNRQLVPMIEKIQALPKSLGRAKRLLADSGYLSQANVEYCAQARIEPLIAMGPSGHNLSWRQRFAEPVFGIIKSAMGYRQCLLRGLKNVTGEWNLVTMSWNIKRMFTLQAR